MFLTSFLRSQLLVTPCSPTADFSGRTVIVTGSNTGLGLEAARHFARLKCTKIILAVRDMSKGQAAKESILASTNRVEDCVEIWKLDLNSNASVQAFAKRAHRLDRLDAVVESAGLMMNSFKLVEGFEQVIQVNVIATLLLALLLLPKLRETAEKHDVETHLEIVTSELHHLTIVKEADGVDLYAALNDEKRYDAWERYSISKALEILFVRELVKHTGKSPIITLVNPGLCYSEIHRKLSGFVESALLWVMKALLARIAEIGSRTLVAGVCTGPESHGEYMSDCENQEVARWVRTSRGEEVQKKAYEQTLAVLQKIEPGINMNV